MKKILLVLICTCVLTLSTLSTAQAETNGMYVAPKFLMTWQNNHADFDESADGQITGDNIFNSQFTVGGALAVGYDFFPQHNLPIRTEIEFALRGNNDRSETFNYGTKFKSTINNSTLMLNLFYDFHNDSDFTPYITAGAGIAFIYAKNVISNYQSYLSVNKNTTNFAWNLGAGIAYNVNENVAIDLGYRYINMGTVESQVYYKGEDIYIDNHLYNHEVALGVRFTF